MYDGTRSNPQAMPRRSTSAATRSSAACCDCAYVAAHKATVQKLANAFVKTLKWINGHSAAEIAAKMPKQYAADDPELYAKSINDSKGMFTADGVHAVEPYLQAWRPVLDRHPDVLLYPTMAAGARGIPVQHRWAHVDQLAQVGGMTLVDPGSVNVGLTSAGAVPDAAADGPYQNSYADLDHMFRRTAELHAAPSISIFEPGFLRTTLTWQRTGRLPRGAIVKLYFGGELEFGLPPTAAALDVYLELLEPSGLPWSVAVMGGDVVACGLAERAIRRGGHVRVGLEDWSGPGEASNAQLVREAGELVERLGRRVATIEESRAILGVPG